jgi:hypothetical protein
MSRRAVSIASLADGVLAEINAADRTKKAATEAAQTVVPAYESEVSRLLRKTATELRRGSNDPTYQDLNAFMAGKL